MTKARVFGDLTIVTSCTGYGSYLREWSASIVAQTVQPGAVVVYTHGSEADRIAGAAAAQNLRKIGLPVTHQHSAARLDFGVARNNAVSLSRTEWVMHFDADDVLLPHAIEEFERVAPGADVISSGYVRIGIGTMASQRRPRLYEDADGSKALGLSALCSGISPFRRSFWERSPYRTDLLGAWDTAFWIGLAHIGARFRATKRPVFQYRQHNDSLFNVRRRILGWARVRTSAQIKALRRRYEGVVIIVPRDANPSPARKKAWVRVRAHYETHHPEWAIVEGICKSAVWIKGEAVNFAVSSTNADVLVVADADCIVHPEALRATVEQVRSGLAPWGMPHRLVYRASEVMTEMYCKQGAHVIPGVPVAQHLARPIHEGAPGGGIFVMKRVWYDAIGGIPLAFRGWGTEDKALACLANTLLGPCMRGEADLLHLYHESQASMAASQPQVKLLQQLGMAAKRGKDALISMVYSLPNPRPLQAGGSGRPALWRRNVGTAVIDPQVMADRQALLQARRRRMP